MEHADKNELASHESLSKNIDDVVDDLFSELAEQLETTDELTETHVEAADSHDNKLTFDNPPILKTPSPEQTTSAIPEEFIKVIRANLKSLTHSAARLTQLERIFTEAPGYGKLYGTLRNLRETTEYQVDSLSRSLAGDYRKFQAPPILPIRRWKMRKKTANASACPWNLLTLARWKDTMVAFVPEQVAYVGSSPTTMGKKSSADYELPLKDLKRWPWDKLQPLFSGKLGELSEQQLAKLKLPVIQHPGLFQTLVEPKDKNYLLILSHENQAGAVFLDSHTEDIFIPSRWAWSRETREDSVLAGHVKVYGKYLPVINIAKQDSLTIEF